MGLRPPVISEKVEQAHTQQFLAGVLRAKVYVIGHPSPNDGRAHRGTGQTPGLADLLAFIPMRTTPGHIALFVESKRKGGRLRPAQEEFRVLCLNADLQHVVGGLDDVIAWALRQGLITEQQVPSYRLPAEAQG